MVETSSNPKIIDILCTILSRNGIVIMKCDTIYGIVGLANQTEQIIAQTKSRPEDKKFLWLIADKSWLGRYSRQKLPAAVTRLWPGPLTVIVNSKDGGTLGVRVPQDRLLVALLKRLKRPLVSTSVNQVSQPPLNEISVIITEFENLVDLIVDAGDFSGALPSTIVDCTAKPYRLVRQGVLRVPDAVLGGN